MQKSIPYLWPKRLKNPTLWGRTDLYSPYKGVPLPPPAPRAYTLISHTMSRNFRNRPLHEFYSMTTGQTSKVLTRNYMYNVEMNTSGFENWIKNLREQNFEGEKTRKWTKILNGETCYLSLTFVFKKYPRFCRSLWYCDMRRPCECLHVVSNKIEFSKGRWNMLPYHTCVNISWHVNWSRVIQPW